MTSARLFLFFLYLSIGIIFSSVSFSQGPRREDPTGIDQRAIPKREVRAAWIVTLRGQNWPKALESEEQRRTLIEIFQSMRSANLNTIVLQVRARGDLL